MLSRSILPRGRNAAFAFYTRRLSTAQAVTPKDALGVFSAGIPSQPQLQTVDIAHAASTTGIYTLPASELSTLKAPLSSISSLFDRFNASPELGTRLNATYPKRGVFKTAALTNALADQKTTIDLSAARLERLSTLAPELIGQLGTEFTDVLDFFNTVERQLVPTVMKATSDAAGIDMAAFHRERNHNYRLVDYFTKRSNQGEETARCGVHKDYGTFSIIFQNGLSGLEYIHPTSGAWTAVAPNHVAVVWGWCSAILSGDRIRATPHRVQSTLPGTRRLSAVLFSAPDINTVLRPLSGNGAGFCDEIRNGEVTVAQFKDISGKQWRVREGNEDGPRLAPGYDPLEAFVRRV